MDLVAEEDGFAACQQELAARFGEDALAVVYAGRGTVDLDETAANLVGEDAGDGGLARAGTAPEDHGGHAISFD